MGNRKLLVDSLFMILVAVSSDQAHGQRFSEDRYYRSYQEPPSKNYDLCDLPYLGNDNIMHLPDNLVRMGPNSKYFIDIGGFQTPIDSVAEFCAAINLQPAEIRNHIELKSIRLFLQDGAPPGTKFSLGINDNKTEGSFTEFGGDPMKFHAFKEREPNDKAENENCVVVSMHPDFEQLVYTDVRCDTPVVPVCMFPPSHWCYAGSPTTYPNINEDLEMIGSSLQRDYFIPVKQQPWSEAFTTCSNAGYRLIDFNSGLSNNQMLYGLVKKWLISKSLFPRIPFWTGAKLVVQASIQENDEYGRPNAPEYRFTETGAQLNNLADWPSLAWDEGEPYESPGVAEECISLILREPYDSTGNNRFALSASNCLLPQYPICYKDKTAVVETSEALQSRLGVDEFSVQEGKIFRREGDGTRRYCRMDLIKVNVSLPELTIPEILRLSALHRHLSLTNPYHRFEYDFDKPWLTNFTELIWNATKRICPNDSVPLPYVHLFRNLLVLYYNDVSKSIPNPPNETIQWLQGRYKYYNLTTFVSGVIHPLNFTSKGGLPTHLNDIKIHPVQETIDGDTFVETHPDMVIEAFWYSYLVTVGSQYPYTNMTFDLLNMHLLFQRYWLEPFSKRWYSARIKNDLGVLVGDVDMKSAYISLKTCAYAVFANNSIPELYFPRPLMFHKRYDELINAKIVELEPPGSSTVNPEVTENIE